MNAEARLEIMFKERELKKHELDLSLECERKACAAKKPEEKEYWVKKARKHAQKASLI